MSSTHFELGLTGWEERGIQQLQPVDISNLREALWLVILSICRLEKPLTYDNIVEIGAPSKSKILRRLSLHIYHVISCMR